MFKNYIPLLLFVAIFFVQSSGAILEDVAQWEKPTLLTEEGKIGGNGTIVVVDYYNVQDQCMPMPAYEWVLFNQMAFHLSAQGICEGQGLLLCYPGQLEGDDLAMPGMAIANPFLLTNQKEGNEVAERCEELRKKMAKGCGKEDEECPGNVGANGWHGILVGTDKNGDILIRLSTTQRTFLVPRNATGEWLIIKLATAKKTISFLSQQFGPHRDLAQKHDGQEWMEKEGMIHVEEDAHLWKEYAKNIHKGVRMNKYAGIWSLGLDLLPIDGISTINFLVERSKCCEMDAWFLTPTSNKPAQFHQNLNKTSVNEQFAGVPMENMRISNGTEHTFLCRLKKNGNAQINILLSDKLSKMSVLYWTIDLKKDTIELLEKLVEIFLTSLIIIMTASRWFLYPTIFASNSPSGMIELFGVVFTEGELWREQRRFTLHVLRDFGMGKNVAQEKILDEIELMFQRIDREIGHPQNEEVNIGQMLDINIGSIINNLLFGYRFDDDKLDEFRRLKGFLDDFLANFYAPIQMLFRWNPRLFRRLPYFRGILNGTIKKNRNFLDFFGGQIQAHLKRGIDFADLDSSSTDFVEAYLKEMAKRDATGEKHGFSIDQLKQLCADLWLGGQETTSTTLAWAIAYLLNNPNVKQKMQRELDEVIGSREAVIKMENRRELPYMNAAINEIQRMANLLPVNLVHKLTRDVVIDGHFLPKGCAINPLISAVLADDEIFENPKQFRPERFLDEKGKLKRVDALIPFSVGKRQCLGESLARMELFLFLANLLNKYEFWPGMDGMPSLMRHFGGTVHCPAYTCRIQKREGRGAA